MGSKRVVIDTGILIEFLRAKNKVDTVLFQLTEKTDLFISAVSHYELMMGAIDEIKIRDVENITKGMIILPFDSEASNVASAIYHELRKSNKMIEFRDIFIAATCIVNKTHRLYILNQSLVCAE